MDQVGAQVEIWKKIVDVQQHFNDLGLRIRNFALIMAGAFLGIGGYALKDSDIVIIFGHTISAASIIIASSIVPLAAFYLMDRLWYHRLLNGSVKAGIIAEAKLTDLGISVDLGSQISQSSPFTIPILNLKVHSRHRMDGFYGLLALALIILSLVVAFGVNASTTVAGTDARRELDKTAVAARQQRRTDDDAAIAVCNGYVADLYSRSSGLAGSFATDPKTGRKAVLIGGRWILIPTC